MQKMEIAAIAQVCHEANRSYCRTIGDYSQLPWEEAPDWQRQSAIAGVEFHFSTWREAHESHSAWMAHKEADGWQYGPVKDPAKKEHPCMVPFDKLPPEQQLKDKLFRDIVNALRF